MSDIDGLKNYERRWLHRRVTISAGPRQGQMGRVQHIVRRKAGNAMIDYVRVALDYGPMWCGTTDGIELAPADALYELYDQLYYSGVCG